MRKYSKTPVGPLRDLIRDSGENVVTWAGWMGVSYKTIYDWLKAGRMPYWVRWFIAAEISPDYVRLWEADQCRHTSS